MTREEFIKVLEGEGYSYEIEGDKIVVTYKGNVRLSTLNSLPTGVGFNNVGNVFLDRLASLPSDVVFRNRGGVYLDYIPSIPIGVEFNNDGPVYFKIIGRYGWFHKWGGNIEGLGSTRLLNLMISNGLFER